MGLGQGSASRYGAPMVFMCWLHLAYGCCCQVMDGQFGIGRPGHSTCRPFNKSPARAAVVRPQGPAALVTRRVVEHRSVVWWCCQEIQRRSKRLGALTGFRPPTPRSPTGRAQSGSEFSVWSLRWEMR